MLSQKCIQLRNLCNRESCRFAVQVLLEARNLALGAEADLGPLVVLSDGYIQCRDALAVATGLSTSLLNLGTSTGM